MADRVARMAERARREPFFLGSVLERFADAERLDAAGLLAALGRPDADLVGLRLCRAPRLDPEGLREDVKRIATTFGLDPDRLTEVIKRAAVLARLQAEPAKADGPNLFVAARDREEGES